VRLIAGDAGLHQTWEPCRKALASIWSARLRLGDRLSGHIVQGHVDGTAEFLGLDPLPDGKLATQSPSTATPGALYDSEGFDYVGRREPDRGVTRRRNARVAIIPHTFENTILNTYRAPMAINVESGPDRKICREAARPGV